MESLRAFGGAAFRDALRGVTGSVGTKALVAASGLLLAGWSCLHLLGTLSVFAGAATMERYAGWLRQGGGLPLWSLRALLCAAFVLHVRLVLGLWARARRARPVGYAGGRGWTAASGARALRWGSVLLLLLIVGHVLHLSFGVGHPRFDPAHVYSNLVLGFDSWPLLLGYVGLAALFGWHVGHGLSAALLSLGAPGREPRRRAWAAAIGLCLGAGFAAVPLAIGLGVVR